MSKDLNKVMIIGRLGVDPEMKYTGNGAAVTSFRVASSRSWKNADGEQQEDTEWFSIVVWNKLAEICNEYLRKGSRVYIEGRLQTRSWDDTTTGEKKYKTEVVATDMIMLDSREGGDSAEPSQQRSNNRQNPARSVQPRANTRQEPFEEDDIPF